MPHELEHATLAGKRIAHRPLGRNATMTAQGMNSTASQQLTNHDHAARLLGGGIAPATSRLLRDVTGDDRAKACTLVQAGLDLGVLTQHLGLWHWGNAPGAATTRLTEIIESWTPLDDTQLTALEALTGPLVEPHALVVRVRLGNRSSIRLTPREREVLRLLCTGLTAGAIARRLELSPRTVTKHQENLYRKLGTTNRLSTVLHAQQLGLTGLP